MKAERPGTLGASLEAAVGFEGAAIVALQYLMDICADALCASHWGDARVLRGMVHLRPKSGYAGLHVLEYRASRLSRPGRNGAFTDAVADNLGYVARSEGGTLFIDEIDKLSLRAQAGLLALIEERRYRVLGDSEHRKADVRFIVGTNADLRDLVERGCFGRDLFYRINVLPMFLPPLRDRRDEIGAWAQFMIQRCTRERHRRGVVELDAKAKEFLTRQPWRGNLRELDNVMHRTHTLASFQAGDDPIRVDARLIERALAFEGGPRSISQALEEVMGALGALTGGA